MPEIPLTPSPSTSEVTQLLAQWANTANTVNPAERRKQTLDQLFPLVYDELKRLAQYHLKAERDNHTLQRTALVHEAFMRLVDQRDGVDNRSLFFSLASRVMRRVLIDHARSKLADKRGAGAPMMSLDQTDANFDEHANVFELGEDGVRSDAGISQFMLAEERATHMLGIDLALQRLEAIDEQQAKVVELRFFGGLSIEETATTLGISPATVKRDWSVAKLWLKRELAE